MSIKTEKGHSEEYFSEYRDHWWNKDFLELMAKRWALRNYSTLLDVGCGQFHWSKLLAPFLDSPEIVGVDSDSKWSINPTSDHKEAFPNVRSLRLIPGLAESLPFPDNSFDVVTCQTTLIHTSNPEKAVMEMRRVVNPDGIVICAEPNNMAPNLSVTSLESIENVSETLDLAKIYLFEQYGKFLAGEGYNSIGDLVPLLFQQAGFVSIRTYLSDKCIPLIPPYETREEKDTIRSIEKWISNDSGPFDSATTDGFLKKAQEILGYIESPQKI